MNPFLWLISTLITLYIWILIANAVLSWLVAFNVVNPHNNVVRTIGEGLYRLTEPALRPIRLSASPRYHRRPAFVTKR